MMKRIIFDLALLAAVLYTPWWIVIPAALAGAFLFVSFYEIFIFGMLVDLLYGTSGAALHGVLGLFTAAIIYICAVQARKFVRPSY
jgi:glucan phosphoethanolaminetransferase (alkaline phosphatase superfamily)